MKKILDDLKYDKSKIDIGINKALSFEKNAANRYNPFSLQKETKDLDDSIEKDQAFQAIKNI